VEFYALIYIDIELELEYMMDLPCVDVACVLGWLSDYMRCRLVSLAKLYSGLRRLTLSSLISEFCCWKICM
jgi:hypothetical protein